MYFVTYVCKSEINFSNQTQIIKANIKNKSKQFKLQKLMLKLLVIRLSKSPFVEHEWSTLSNTLFNVTILSLSFLFVLKFVYSFYSLLVTKYWSTLHFRIAARKDFSWKISILQSLKDFCYVSIKCNWKFSFLSR